MRSANTEKHSAASPLDESFNNVLTPEAGLVSVIIPCYNHAQFLPEAIESALNQSYSRREILVVDDGSIDDTAKVTGSYKDVQYIHQKNSGVSAARNNGWKQSRGEYLVFLDADDRLLPKALEIGVYCLLQHPDCAFASGHCRLIVADGSLLDEKPKQAHILSHHYLELLRGNYRIWCPGSVVYRRSAFDVVNGFDTSLGPGADYDLYLRLARDFPVCCHGQFVTDYRCYSSSMSADHSIMLREVLKALESQWDFVKGRQAHIDALEAGQKYWQGYYRSLELGDRILQVVEANLPPHATVAVATGGKKELLKLGGRRAWHFPQTGANALGRLFAQGTEGSVDVPWIQAGVRYEFRLFGGPECSKELASISVTGVAKVSPSPAPSSATAGRVCLAAAPNPVPVPNRFGWTTIIWDTGDDSEGRIYLSEGGDYDSNRLKDSSEAISRLEAIRARGAQYLLLPATEFWWLNYYQNFREHLEARYPAVVRDESTCIIFDLREPSQELCR